jgi:hypothetical protein
VDRRRVSKPPSHTNRLEPVPYCISFTPDGERGLQEPIGERTAKDFADNGIIQIEAPWWGWHQLAPEWGSRTCLRLLPEPWVVAASRTSSKHSRHCETTTTTVTMRTT